MSTDPQNSHLRSHVSQVYARALSLKARVQTTLRVDFVRSAGILVIGTAAAQFLTALTLPILTRLYTPDDFSILAAYTAILAMITVVACLRFEMAIPLPEDDVEAANLLATALLLASGTALASVILIAVWGDALFDLKGLSQMRPYRWILPLGIWCGGNYLALQFWTTRKKHFPLLARTRLTQVGSGLATQLTLGFAGAGPIGLLLGQTLMGGAGVLSLLHRTMREDVAVLRRISVRGMLQISWRYRNLPKFSTIEALANDAVTQLPILLIAALAIGPEAGFVLLAMRAVGMPVTMIGGAVKQVFLSRATEEMRRERLADFTTDVLGGLARVGVAPLVFGAIIAPAAFSLLFGDEWRRAGVLVSWMAPWFIFRLLSSPVAAVMHVRMMQRSMLTLMLGGVALSLAGTLSTYAIAPTWIAEGYAVSCSLFYLIALSVYIHASGAGWAAARRMIAAALWPTIIGVLAGLLFSVILAPWLRTMIDALPIDKF